MTFEEIREMVSSTITENGQRQITGKALNLALLETLTAVEEYLANNKPEGAGIETVYLYDDPDTMELTPEHQAINAEVYAKCEAALAEGKPLPGVQADASCILISQGVSVIGVGATMVSITTLFVTEDSPMAEQGTGLMVTLSYMGSEFLFATIAPDGSVTSIQ